VRDEDKISHSEKFSVITFNIPSFPISKLLNPELHILQRKDILIYKSVYDVAHDV